MAADMSLPLRQLSHAYIVSAPDQELCFSHAKKLAAAAVCSAAERPCGLCRNCRKAEAGVHPDIRIVRRLEDDKGIVKKNLLVEQTRELLVDAYVLPNEADGKAYIILDADTMNPNAQNAALKLLEEPPRGVVFILCVTNAAALLPTVRSRCVELNFGGQAGEKDAQADKIAGDYLKAVASGSEAELFRWFARNEGMDTRRCSAFMDAAQDMAADILCGRENGIALEAGQLMHISELISRCRKYSTVNTGTKHILGLLAVDSILKAETEEN